MGIARENERATPAVDDAGGESKEMFTVVGRKSGRVVVGGVVLLVQNSAASCPAQLPMDFRRGGGGAGFPTR